eukprot:gene2768-3022_t
MIASCDSSCTAFFKKTRKGKVVRFVREKYQRTDIGLGSLRGSVLDAAALQDLVEECPNQTLVVIDTNIALHEIDLLEQESPLTALLVVTQTVLQELRHRNFAAFKRVRALMDDGSRSIIFYPNEVSSETLHLRAANESVNDANDQAIVNAALVFQKSLKSPAKVVFVTNDALNKKRAEALGLSSYDMRQYLTAAGANELVELASSSSAAALRSASEVEESYRASYPDHLSASEIQEGLRAGRFVRGVLHVQKDAWTDAYVVVHEGTERRSIQLVGAENINRGLEGDLVAVALLRSSSSSSSSITPILPPSAQDEVTMALTEAEPSYQDLEALPPDESAQVAHGRVVGIIRRSLRQYAGSVDANSAIALSSGEHLVRFLAVDRRLPPVLVSTRRLDEIVGQRLLVGLDGWPSTSALPCGHCLRVLGAQGDRAVETEVLLFELGVSQEAFSPAVLACLPPADWTITPEEIALRSDLRHLPIASVDPPGCKDIDDALHCIPLPNGNFQVGVHIADVGHFVLPDTPLDREASQRCTSTYLVEKRLDMLPEALTTRLCSLRAAEDHLTFSVLWEIDGEGNIVDASFCKSVIHSRAAMSYAEAQEVLDRPPGPNEPDTHLSLRLLARFARILRARRIAAGALTLASPEVRFQLDEARNPLDVALYTLREANAMVEEWMLLANITVAKKTLQHFPTLALLRRHQPPSREQFAPLVQAAALKGVSLDISSSLALSRSLDAAQRSEDPFFNKLLRILSTRCMMPAAYFCSGELPKASWHHYGLAAPVYTHFTSPIRRYADIVVHRLLAAAIGVSPLPSSCADRRRLAEQSTQMNRRHRAAQQAQRASVQLYTVIFFRDRASSGKQQAAQEEEAYVLQVSPQRLDVLVPHFGFEGPLWVSEISEQLQAQSFFDEDRGAVVWQMSKAAPGNKRESEIRVSVLDRLVVAISTVLTPSNDRVLKLSLVPNSVQH